VLTALNASGRQAANFAVGEPVTPENYGRVADNLRRDLRVAQVICIAPDAANARPDRGTPAAMPAPEALPEGAAPKAPGQPGGEGAAPSASPSAG
jgi:hypothetical protein